MRIIDFIIYGIAISYGIAIAAAYTVIKEANANCDTSSESLVRSR